MTRSRDTSNIFDPNSDIVNSSELNIAINTASAAAVAYTDSELGTIDLSSTIQTASAAAVTYLVNSAPSTLDTLNELATALGNDANFSTTVTNSLASKLNSSTASATYLTQSSASTTYLTQTSASTLYSLPTQTGNSGKYLITNGASASWSSVDALPSQTSNSGKYLTTNGISASWATLDLNAGIVTASTAAASYADNLIANLPPLISGISPDNIVGTASTAIIVNGQNFKSGSIVKIVDISNTELFTLSTTFNNARSLQFLTPALTASAGPYDIKVTNPDNQVSILENALTVGQTPVWNTTSGSLGNIFDTNRSSTTFQLSATDPDGTSLTYYLAGGSLPPNMTLSSSGLISGSTSAVASDTTYSFTARVSDGLNISDRNFSIIVKAPVKQIFSYTGSIASFTVPASITTLNAKVWGAGGGGGRPGGWGQGSDGGSGGYASGSITVTPGQVLNIVVGQGGVNGSTSRNFGGGGANCANNTDNIYGAGGGGYSGIFRSTVSQTDALIIAGGGGGGGSSRTAGQGVAGGAGGGTAASDGSSTYDGKTSYRGRGGTTSGAGVEADSAGVTTSQPAGALTGGSPRTNSYGGAGGGGYWGGSAGGYSESNTMAGGGGGSGFIDSSRVSNSQNLTGTNRVPPNTGDSDYPGSSIGYGNTYNSGNGFPGYIVISY